MRVATLLVIWTLCAALAVRGLTRLPAGSRRVLLFILISGCWLTGFFMLLATLTGRTQP